MRQRLRRDPYYAHLDMDPRWHHFDFFLADMGECPSSDSIERVDNTRGYWPDNCVWLPFKEQAKNRRNTIWCEWNGERHNVKDWCEILGLKRFTVYSRIRKGWAVEQALELIAQTQKLD